MFKFFIKILLILSIFFTYSTISNANIDFNSINWVNVIKDKSIQAPSGWNFADASTNMAKSIFKTLKVIIWWLLVIYLIYAGINMVLSMWDNEEKLSSAKRSVWYAVVWLLFINIPGTLFDIFWWDKGLEWWNIWWQTFVQTNNSISIFVNTDMFNGVLAWIISFLQISIVSFAILIIIIQWIKVINARWNDENISEAKNKILYSIWWLIFIWIMEVWRNIIVNWWLVWWKDITWEYRQSGFEVLFSSMANLALFFAWPIAIFFLTLAWFYYITAWGDEEKIKKAKNIVINTVLATLILLWMYTFLIELGWGLWNIW